VLCTENWQQHTAVLENDNTSTKKRRKKKEENAPEEFNDAKPWTPPNRHTVDLCHPTQLSNIKNTSIVQRMT
jgi:hypothetical protein